MLNIEFKHRGIDLRKINLLDKTIDDSYFITRKGEVYKAKDDTFKKLKKYIGKRGYFCVTLYSKETKKSHTFTIHTLMKFAFFNVYDPNIFINHIDLNKLNNDLDNLELSDPLHNTHHAIKLGAIQATCLTPQIIFGIRDSIEKFKYKFKYINFVNKYNISMISVKRIVTGDIQGLNLKNLDKYMYLPDNYTYEKMSQLIKRICTEHKKYSISYFMRTSPLGYDAIKNILKDFKNYNTTTKVYGRYFNISDVYSTAVS